MVYFGSKVILSNKYRLLAIEDDTEPVSEDTARQCMRTIFEGVMIMQDKNNNFFQDSQ